MEGPFYPKKTGKGFSELKFYSGFFDCVEVNSTYYRHFPPAMAEKWLADVRGNPKFVFLIKLFKEFTHGTREKDEGFIKNKKIVEEFLEPFMEQGRLGEVFVQFSEYFRDSIPAKAYLSIIMEEFHGLPLFFELRHVSWYTEHEKEFIKQNDINLTAIDQPPLKDMIGFDTKIFGKIGYVRLHGRNSAMWGESRKALREGVEIKDADRNARYDYLYGTSELDEIEKKIRKVKERCDRVIHEETGGRTPVPIRCTQGTRRRTIHSRGSDRCTSIKRISLT